MRSAWSSPELWQNSGASISRSVVALDDLSQITEALRTPRVVREIRVGQGLVPTRKPSHRPGRLMETLGLLTGLLHSPAVVNTDALA